MDAPQGHRDLLAWQESMALAEMVYKPTTSFPRQEVYGLVSQLRRCAISIPSNIAEGAARNSSRELLQFLGISCGSLAELDTQLVLSVRLGYLNPDAIVIHQARRVSVLVSNFRKSIKART